MTAAHDGVTAVDARPWPRGAISAEVVVTRIRSLGLRPEDCYGVLPTERNGRELVLLYRDRDAYRQGRATSVEAFHGGRFHLPGIQFAGAGGPLSQEERADALQFVATQLQQAGLDALVPGLVAPPARAEPATDYASIYVHGLQWPRTRRVVGWETPERALTSYAWALGLRPEDVYGFFPGSWSVGRDSDHWSTFFYAYRDRPEYAAARERLRADRRDRWETGEAGTYPGAPAAPLATSAVRPVRVDESPWPRGRLLRLRGDEAANTVADRLHSMGVRPEDSFGVGPDQQHDRLWIAIRS